MSTKYKMQIIVPETIKNKMLWLQYTLGYSKFTPLLNFTLSLTEVVVKSVLSGKQLALYDPKTDEIELLHNQELDRIAQLRNEQP